MTSASLETWLLRITKGSIFALAFVGLVFYPNILYPDVFTKGLFVRLCITIALFGYVWLLALRKVSLPKITPFVCALIAFFGFVVLSMLFSPSIYRSFWGEAQRMEGVFGLLHYGVLFCIASVVFQKKDWMSYFKLVILTVPLLMAYWVLQYSVLKFGFKIPFVFAVGASPGSLFGNPAFFSMFLIFTAGFSLFVYFLEIKRAWKIYAFVALALSFFGILVMGIRGEVLGMIAGILAYAGLYAFRDRHRHAQKYFIAGILLCLVVFSFIVVLRPALQDYYPRLVTRIINLPHEPSFLTRWYSIQSSVRAWLDSPKTFFLGWGQEHFMTGYNKYYNPLHGTIEDVWFDRAHHKPADVLVTGGIFGVISYTALFVVLLWYMRRLWKIKETQIISVVSTSIIVAYVVQNLAIFDLPHSYVNFFLLAAFVDSLANHNFSVGAKNPKKDYEKSSMVFLIGAAILTVMLVVLVVYTIIIPLRQSRLYLYYFRDTHNGDELIKNKDTIFMPRNFAHYTLLDDIWRRLQVQDAFRDPAFDPITKVVIDEMTRATEREPYDAQMMLRLGNIYTEHAIGTNSIDEYKEGERYALRAIELSPTRQESYYLLAFNLQGQGRKDEALERMRYAVALNPNTQKAQYVLGVNLALAGNIEEAVLQIERVRKAGWFANSQSGFQDKDVKNVVKIYSTAGRYDLVDDFLMWALQEKVTKDPAYFTYIIGRFIAREDALQVANWGRLYAKTYPEFNETIERVIKTAEEGKWDEVRRLVGIKEL